VSEQTSLAGGSNGRKVIYEDKGLVLCPDDMSDVDAIRYALEMLDSREDADKIFQDLFDIGKLVKISARVAEQ